MLYTILIVFHVVLAASLIAIVLIQRGPGATMGAAFGAGASGTVFGARGSASFLTRTTTWLGIAFFAISLSMAVIAARSMTVVASPDDLGVAAGAVEPTLADDRGDAVDDEFLTVPTDENARSATETPAAESASDDAIDAVTEEANQADNGEPPLS